MKRVFPMIALSLTLALSMAFSAVVASSDTSTAPDTFEWGASAVSVPAR